VWAWCEKAVAFGWTITVKVKFVDFRQATRSRSFPTAISRQELLRQISVELVRSVLPTKTGIRLFGVSVSSFDRLPIDAAYDLPLFFRDLLDSKACSRRQRPSAGDTCKSAEPCGLAITDSANTGYWMLAKLGSIVYPYLLRIQFWL